MSGNNANFGLHNTKREELKEFVNKIYYRVDIAKKKDEWGGGGTLSARCHLLCQNKSIKP